MIGFEFVKGAALLLSLAMLQTFVLRIWRKETLADQVLSGVAFGGVSLVGMAMPLALLPGIIFDPRSVILSVAGFWGGPLVGLISGGIAATYRLWLGGAGAATGAAVVASSVLIGLGYRWLVRRRGWPAGPWALLVFGVVVHVGVVLWMLTLPGDVGFSVMRQVGLPNLVVFSPAVMLLGILLADVDRRFATEAALRESEERFRAFMDASPVIASIKDENGRLSFVNSAAETAFKVKPGAWLGKTLFDFAPEETVKRITAADDQVLRTGRPVEYTDEINSFEGRQFYLHTVKFPMRSAAGQPLVGTIAIDVTERRLAEARLQAILDHSAALISIKDLKGNILLTNRQFEVLEGPAPEDYVGRNIFDLFPKDVAEVLWRNDLAALDADGPIEAEETVRHRDGSWHTYLTVKFPVSVGDKPPFGVCAISTDITDRKAAVEALRESEERFQLALENVPDVIVIYDRDLRIRFINAATQRITGRLPSDFIGKRDDEVWPPEVYESYLPTLRKARETGTMQSLEAKIQLTEGSPHQLRITCVPVLDDDGNVREVLGITHDLTDQRRLERSLRQSQKMEAVGQLTGGIAHDFNNLLGVIQGNVELLKGMVAGVPNAARQVDAALRSVQRGADLTRKLLGFSHAEAHGIRRVAVNEFVAGVKNLIAKSLTPAIHVETVLADDVWPVEIDPGDLENSILNLALNARDAMPDGGTLVIETANRVIDEDYARVDAGSAAGEYVMISVGDSGAGMTPEVAERAFEPFFTTKAVGKGTGLGLSMVYGFVQRSGGHARIYSEPGKGTTVRLYLPRATGEIEDSNVKRVAHGDMPRGSETVLVVDDEEQLLAVAVAHLEGLGYVVLSARDGHQALEIVKGGRRIDLLFTDIVMPGDMDGYRLAGEAVALRPGLKVLLTSGFTRKREMLVNGHAELSNRLARTLLSKPYNLGELAARVRQALDEDVLEGKEDGPSDSGRG